ncbi:hypothetical protein ACFLSZ_07590, partial [Candidatus Bipolaricaulota bacterium]
GEMVGLGEDTNRFHRDVVELALSLPIDSILPIGQAAVSACRAVDASRMLLLPREEIAQHLKRRLSPETTVLIKGSRALELETLVEELQPSD